MNALRAILLAALVGGIFLALVAAGVLHLTGVTR